MTQEGALRGRDVLVAGAGVSGRSAAEALLAEGATVTVTDAAEERLAGFASLRAEGAHLTAGLQTPPEGTDLVVTSPGWRPEAPLLASAREAGIEVIGEVELAWRLDLAKADADTSSAPSVWLGVTGTNGKTTTVGMLEAILRAAGRDAVACGNVGLPVVDAVRAGHDVLAVELSSFQLHWSNSVAPYASVALNVAADHLDWHGSLAAYGDAKGRIYAGTSIAVYNADDETSTRLAASSGWRVPYTLAEPAPGALGVSDGRLVDRAFAEEPVALASVADVHPAAPHNVANALAAAALARAYKVPAEAVRDGLRAFEPGVHRSIELADVRGVRYVDDSKATNPHAAAAALRAHPRVVWIAGGLLKGAEVDELIAAHTDRLEGVVLIGADRARFREGMARHAPQVPVVEVDSGDDAGMLHAVRKATELASPGSVVLLAPAAASMDMFVDYAHRGQAFAEAVRAMSSTVREQ